MVTFKYSAKDQSNKAITGKMEADDQSKVLDELRKRNLIVISINEVKSVQSFSIGGGTVKQEELVIFTRQLSTMVDAGIPILQSLEALHEQTTKPYFKGIIATLRDDIELGSSMFAAFSKHPKIFDTLFVNMIKVGEAGGVLSPILERISKYMEKALKLKNKVKSAMIYPIIIVSMAMIITIILLAKVVPVFVSMYAGFDQELPPMTKLLVKISDVVRGQLLFLVGGGIAAVVGYGQLNKTKRWSLIFDQIKLRLPIFGDLIRKVSVARFCSTLATLTQSGVPILESLDIVAKTCGNRVLEVVTEQTKESIREGESISAPLAKSRVFPPMAEKMIGVGEKAGELEKMCKKVAEFYEDEVDTMVAGLRSIIEPIIIAFLGIVIGVIVLASFLPILYIPSGTQGYLLV